MTRLQLIPRICLLSLLPASFGLVLGICGSASALPPDPGNTCGGNGACFTEANEVEYWQNDLEDLHREWTTAQNDYWDCFEATSEAWRNDTPHPGCTSEYEHIQYINELLDRASIELGSAQDGLETCIEQTNCD